MREKLSFSRVPVFSTIRDWVLKLGHYKLTSPKEPGQWVLIIDSSIQMGSMKCLLILGVRIDKPTKNGDYQLSHCDVEPIILKTLKSSPGEVIDETLREAENLIGGAFQGVLTDQANEFKRGISIYNTNVNKTVHLFDINHKLDLIVKKEFEADELWKCFTTKANQTLHKLKLTEFSHLVPPKQRQKNRFLSEIDSVKWGIKLLNFFYQYGNTMPQEQLDKISWISQYELTLARYLQISNISKIAIDHVRKKGYYIGCHKDFMEYFLDHESTNMVPEFYQKVCKAIEEECIKLPVGVRIPGSSEVIESTFGKFKQLEKGNASGGLSSLVLSIPAFLGKTTKEIVAKAMENTKISSVQSWVKENLGITFWSKRRRDLKTPLDEMITENNDLNLHESKFFV